MVFQAAHLQLPHISLSSFHSQLLLFSVCSFHPVASPLVSRHWCFFCNGSFKSDWRELTARVQNWTNCSSIAWVSMIATNWLHGSWNMMTGVLAGGLASLSQFAEERPEGADCKSRERNWLQMRCIKGVGNWLHNSGNLVTGAASSVRLVYWWPASFVEPWKVSNGCNNDCEHYGHLSDRQWATWNATCRMATHARSLGCGCVASAAVGWARAVDRTECLGTGGWSSLWKSFNKVVNKYFKNTQGAKLRTANSKHRHW